MNDPHYRHRSRPVTRLDPRRFVLDDEGLALEPGERVVVETRSPADELHGRRGTVIGFLESKTEPIATVQFDQLDGAERVFRRALRRA